MDEEKGEEDQREGRDGSVDEEGAGRWRTKEIRNGGKDGEGRDRNMENHTDKDGKRRGRISEQKGGK